jgi:transposase-like protein
LLPIFPAAVAEISRDLAVCNEDGKVTYFHGALPVFSHAEDDLKTFRMITSQFCCNGNAREVDIIRAFGVSKMSVLRAVKKYQQDGPAGFYAPRRSRGPAVLTPPVMTEAQRLLDEGRDLAEVAAQLGIKHDTLSKAARAGRLHEAKKKEKLQEPPRRPPS